MNGHYTRTCGHVFHFGCMIPWLDIIKIDLRKLKVVKLMKMVEKWTNGS
jgi:hypothetical protein